MPEDPNATASQGTPVLTPAPPARGGRMARDYPPPREGG